MYIVIDLLTYIQYTSNRNIRNLQIIKKSAVSKIDGHLQSARIFQPDNFIKRSIQRIPVQT